MRPRGDVHHVGRAAAFLHGRHVSCGIVSEGVDPCNRAGEGFLDHAGELGGVVVSHFPLEGFCGSGGIGEGGLALPGGDAPEGIVAVGVLRDLGAAGAGVGDGGEGAVHRIAVVGVGGVEAAAVGGGEELAGGSGVGVGEGAEGVGGGGEAAEIVRDYGFRGGETAGAIIGVRSLIATSPAKNV